MGERMASRAQTVDEYLAALPPEQAALVGAIRQTILDNLDPNFEEGMQYGMIGYYVPHRVYPAGYHCDPKQPLPFAGLAANKSGVSLHLMGLYGNPEELARFVEEWKKTGKKLDMGKACVRLRKLDDVPLKVIGDSIRRMSVESYVSLVETQRVAAQRKGPAKTSE